MLKLFSTPVPGHLVVGAWLMAAAATAGAAKVADAAPGLSGQIWLQQVCPVGQNCPAGAGHLIGVVVEVARQDGEVAGRAYTNSLGRFVVSVPLGAYTLRVLTPANATCPALAVTLAQPKFKAIGMVCSTTDDPVPIALRGSVLHVVELAPTRFEAVLQDVAAP